MRPRGRTLAWLASVSGALAAGAMGGCVDLFHSTDFETACDLDAQACLDAANDSPATVDGRADGGVPGDGAVPSDAADGSLEAEPDVDSGPPPPTDFCTWTVAQAHASARHACAWLGACASPMGENAFGKCLDHAILAYDCTVNPNRRVIGRAFAFWDCLWKATTCDEVKSCVLPSGPQGCSPSGSEFANCASVGDNVNTAVDCPNSGTTPIGLENCSIVGRACGGSPATCLGGSTCSATGATCDSATHLRDCVGSGPFTDNGQDCSNYGAGACANVAGGTAACKPNGGASCSPSPSITCVNLANATGCATGARETVDCRGLMEDAGTCNASQAGRPWDVASACVASANQCSSESCAADGGLHACHRGQSVDIACGDYGLKPCAVQTNLLVPAPACAPP